MLEQSLDQLLSIRVNMLHSDLSPLVNFSLWLFLYQAAITIVKRRNRVFLLQ